jgi:hypothetical protein
VCSSVVPEQRTVPGRARWLPSTLRAATTPTTPHRPTTHTRHCAHCRTLPHTAAHADAILARTNALVRRVLRPLGRKMLALQGLDPCTADPAAARAALAAGLTPAQQRELDAEAQRLFTQVCGDCRLCACAAPGRKETRQGQATGPERRR